MKRFRIWRRRTAALALLPATALISIAITSAPAGAAEGTVANFSAGKGKVRSGAKVKLRGRFPARIQTQAAGETTPRRDRRVRLEFQPAGKDRWQRAKTTLSDRKGRYSRRVKVRRSGFFRAVAADGQTSKPERIRVKSRLRAEVKRKHARVGQRVAIVGRVKPATRRKVIVRIGGKKLKTHTNGKGRFKLRWSAAGAGTYKAKAKARGDRVAAGSKAKAGRTTVYRPVAASYYGPGLYGGRTACGQTLTPSTEGVAHKTMPCGTKLRLRYGARTVTARVIDRGPYAAGRELDLTYATKRKLGFGSTGTVYSSR
jgi:rare lipoprotein A (peptidoglycan hydrolase)